RRRTRPPTPSSGRERRRRARRAPPSRRRPFRRARTRRAPEAGRAAGTRVRGRERRRIACGHAEGSRTACPRKAKRRSVAQIVAAVPAGVLLEILLMIVLGGPELAGGDDLGHDRAVPLARARDALLHALGDLPLLVVVIEDGGAVLRADVVVLAVHRRGVVHAEKVAEQLLVAALRRIEDHLDGLGVTGVAAAHVAIGGILRAATGVADVRLDDGRARARRGLH